MRTHLSKDRRLRRMPREGMVAGFPKLFKRVAVESNWNLKMSLRGCRQRLFSDMMLTLKAKPTAQATLKKVEAVFS
jgi:hypothetical protein